MGKLEKIIFKRKFESLIENWSSEWFKFFAHSLQIWIGNFMTNIFTEYPIFIFYYDYYDKVTQGAQASQWLSNYSNGYEVL